ncbi:MAG: AmmeMemoRadiSam system protein B [Pseudomonadota bacterium]
MTLVRRPAVAGTFYPSNPDKLHRTLQNFLSAVPVAGPAPKAIIVPHAGYIYSGPVAATAYSRLRQGADKIERVVLLGPSHHVAFRGLAVCGAEVYLTPFGAISIDKESITRALELPFVSRIDEAHALEHSLEVHLPFLQEVLNDFTLVPVVAGDATPEEVSQLLDLLWGGEETVIVVSSDLSHYHDYATSQQMDSATSNAIESLDYEAIGYECACGRVPVSGILHNARKRHMKAKTIDLRNSGDTAGPKDKVVGYGAYVIE